MLFAHSSQLRLRLVVSPCHTFDHHSEINLSSVVTAPIFQGKRAVMSSISVSCDELRFITAQAVL